MVWFDDERLLDEEKVKIQRMGPGRLLDVFNDEAFGMDSGLVGEALERGHCSSDVGRKDDGEKSDWTLLPFSALEPVVRVLMFGAKKYQRDNWKFVDDGYRRYLAAAYRHLNAAVEGEWLDEGEGGSNQPHLANAICCLLFALWLGMKRNGKNEK